MYIPSTFSETNIEVLKDLIKRHPLGLLVSSGSSGLIASPIPFLFKVRDAKSYLVSHLAKANPHWKDIVQLKECLVVFQGFDNYVSPDWYPSKKTTHKVVPTWNYEMVQVTGVPNIIESTDWLKEQVSDVTDSMEIDRKNRWKVSDAPSDFIETQLKAIVGLEIEITQIKGKWKMSQNRSPEDALGVVDGLSNPSDPHSNFKVAQIVSSRILKK